jgi:ligand-binding sensor domain-containing protein
MRGLHSIIPIGLFAILCLTRPLSAQLFDAQLSRYSTKDGLSQHSILAIAEDSLGYIWVGTRNGVNRFNGYEFITAPSINLYLHTA